MKVSPSGFSTISYSSALKEKYMHKISLVFITSQSNSMIISFSLEQSTLTTENVAFLCGQHEHRRETDFNNELTHVTNALIRVKRALTHTLTKQLHSSTMYLHT